MFVRSLCLFALTSPLAMAARGELKKDTTSYGTLVREDFFFTQDNDQEPHGHLRRQLQGSCRPLTYETKNRDCGGTYRCICNGVETDCPYCEIETSSIAGTVCQQSGTTSTFTINKQSPEIRTCSCNYYGSGDVVSNCGPQTPPDTSVPPPAPVPPPVPVPVPNPTSGDRADGGVVPSPGVPANPAPPLNGLQCTALWSYSPRICTGTPEQCPIDQLTCSIMGTHPCVCQSSFDFQCHYCKVQTATDVFCQVVGSQASITGPDGTPQTCSCDYAGYGQTVQNCTPNTPAVPAPPVPAPVSVPVPVPAPPVPAFSLTPAPVDRIDGVSNPSPGIEFNAAPPLAGLGCTARTPFSPRVCIGTPEECPVNRVSCSLFGQHPCSCTGSADTQCSYCQVQTATEMFCQVVGSAVTVSDPNGGLKTCTCDYAGNGQAIQTCT